MKRKPLHPTSLSPEEIIGEPRDIALIESHFTLSLKHSDPERWEKAMQKTYTEAERTHVATIYEKLRDKGLYPRAIDRFGGIEWGIATKGNVQDYVERYPLIPREKVNG